MTQDIDPIELSQALIRCASVTPEDGGALDVVQGALRGLGFNCRRLPFSEAGTADVDNLYARLGTGAPHFCFAGHTDVVPAGDAAQWSHDPFGAGIENGRLYGRGAADMKCAIACFAAAAGRFLAAAGGNFGGSISMLITGDEEGPSINGTAKVLKWMRENGEVIDACLVGEPTNPRALGEMIKIGRRGSLNGHLCVPGTQGHSAYPDLADNPIPRLLRMLAAINEAPLDNGNDHFQPSTVEITTIDVGNPATNIIPARAAAAFNIRFNNRHHGDGLEAWIRKCCESVGGDFELSVEINGEAFLAPPGPLSDVVAAAVEEVTGRRPELSTTGGTSDARFIKDYCLVAEFGLIGETAHKVDENVAVADIRSLAEIYQALLERYFAKEAAEARKNRC
ncbi:MAG TPA: succinyl-diaminopimelate desuccinylase [Rhodospirillales bacterium]|jgi:succinyl-diaminopimelate desuccinylase|nr:succinyl-diaminopimelate desuccinylase [Rhodospirillales bacterium]